MKRSARKQLKENSRKKKKVTYEKPSTDVRATKAKILEDPYSNIGLLNDVMEGLSSNQVGKVVSTIHTVSDVLLSLLPTYPLREHPEKENHLSKGIIAVRNFEQILLSSYTKFVEVLKLFLKTPLNQKEGRFEESIKLKEETIEALCQFLIHKPNSNHTKEISVIIVHKLVCKNEEIRRNCFTVLSNIMAQRSDAHSELKYHIIKTFSNRLKNVKHSKFDPNILELLQGVNINVVEQTPQLKEEIRKIKKEVQLKKKQGKIRFAEDYETEAIKQLEEKSGISQHSKYDDMLVNEMVMIYLDFIQNHTSSPLFPVALKCLQSFAYKIKSQIMWQIVEMLELYTKSQIDLPNCNFQNVIPSILAALKIIDTSASSFQVDEKSIIECTHKLLIKAPEHYSLCNKNLIGQILDILTHLIVSKRQYSMDLVAAFVEDCIRICYCLPEWGMHGFCILLKQIQDRYQNIKSMFVSAEGDKPTKISVDINGSNASKHTVYHWLCALKGLVKNRNILNLLDSIITCKVMPDKYVGLKASDIFINNIKRKK